MSIKAKEIDKLKAKLDKLELKFALALKVKDLKEISKKIKKIKQKLDKGE